MNKIRIFQVDAFTEENFKGNPAAVCPLDKWIDDILMQKIAMENNLSETAFFVKEGEKYRLRWFTPEREIKLCGHATLATSFVIFNYIETESKEIIFDTLSGDLHVTRNEELISMSLPRLDGRKVDIDERLIEALGVIPLETYKAEYLMVVLSDEDDIRYLKPNMDILKQIVDDGIILTAKGRHVDFVSRFFVPNSIINEDPVTGSAHCTLAPYWSKRLEKNTLNAEQLSKRSGKLLCEVKDDIINISGYCKLFLVGNILL